MLRSDMGTASAFKFDVDTGILRKWIRNNQAAWFQPWKNISKELLGYLDGGFIKLYEKMADKIRENGGEIRLNHPVQK